jgi:two-component system, chemotaxis family, CheB/CheR fusion protein
MKKANASGGRRPRHFAAARKAMPVPSAESVREACPSFPIVGLGASAGGLEALEQFFKQVPKKCGLGFVVVQHLDPTHKGILAELLQRSTTMPVVQIKDRMKIEPDHVYVIPPNKDLSVLHGVLHLLEPAAPRGLRLPIDFFFRSLADDRKEESLGVILSGMGSDGTLGLRAIKEKAGAVFVQSPASAKFDSMPRTAIDAGLADVIAPAEELPGKIIAYLKHVPLLVRKDQDLDEKDQGALEKIVILLRGQSGQDFSLYKKSTIHRRVERRMGLHQIARIGDYVRYLRENPQESELLFKELLIGVTSFFRDPAVWEQLKDKVIPDFLKTHSQGGMLRAWVAGCSTGEEAYSLAMVFREALERIKPARNFSLQIFATDLDKDAIDKARAGVYPANISADVSEHRLRRFFLKDERGNYSVKKEVREMVIFAPQNLVMHPPFTRLDFVSCRNLLIYLEADLQKKLMPLFHYSLNPGGILLLGSAETIGVATDLFVPLAGKSRLYRRLDNSRPANLVEFPSAFSRARTNKTAASSVQPGTMAPAPNLQSLADQLLLQRYSPAAVLVTQEGDILYVSGKTGKYLEPAAGKANWNLFAMCREGLGSALSEAFHKAVREKIIVTLKDVAVSADKGRHMVDITVQPVSSPEALRGMVMVVFTDVAAPSTTKPPNSAERTTIHNARLSALAQDLRQAHEDLQATRDEMQISQEELKSTNEEMQSMNEELQSTNEELTTSKEEMQSMNEELQTVNHELQAKVDELSRTSDDMKNLLESTDIATLFLDDALAVRRFTTQTASVIKLIPGDVGRPVTDLVTSLDYPKLPEDARNVMKTLLSVERQISAGDGRWFSVRIMPYRTQENRIDGVVITFTDITVAKNLEVALRKTQSDLQERFTSQTAALGKARENLQSTRPSGKKIDPAPRPDSSRAPKKPR